MAYPKMIRIRQKMDATKVQDVVAKVREELARIHIASFVKGGQTVALTSGSRGVANVGKITKTVVDELKKIGAKPFIVPTMGSHGGATAEGQKAVLSYYGITEESMGCPLKASMEVVSLGETAEGIPLYLDKYASEADHIGVIARIKPHTDFSGEIESGWYKMMAIGLGKHKGAQYYHQAAVQHGFSKLFVAVGRELLRRTKISFGVGMVENGYDQTAIIEAVRAAEMEATERRLQKRSKELLAHLPFDKLDVLIVDEMGKDVTGAGLDPNVIGRIMNVVTPEPESPKVLRIVARDLTEATEGNAVGIGLADFITKRLYDKIDYEKTKINCLCGISPEKGRVPIVGESDQDAIDMALATIGNVPPEKAKVIWIKSTLILGEVEVSEAFQEEVAKRPDLEPVTGARDMKFDSQGNFLPL
jgi:hypothetical protein